MNMNATTVTAYQMLKGVMDTMIVWTAVTNGIAAQVQYWLLYFVQQLLYSGTYQAVCYVNHVHIHTMSYKYKISSHILCRWKGQLTGPSSGC